VIKICVNANPIIYKRIKRGRVQPISAQVRVYSDDEYIFEKTRSLSGSRRGFEFQSQRKYSHNVYIFPFADPPQARIQSKMI